MLALDTNIRTTLSGQKRQPGSLREGGKEEAFSFPPVDEEVLAEERGDDHPDPIVHPAGCCELSHARVDDRDPRPADLPGFERLGGLAPPDGGSIQHITDISSGTSNWLKSNRH